jgi:hypothetical protein
MLAEEGICYVDLLIVDRGSVDFNVESNGSITIIEDTSILSTMMFCLNVYASSVDNSEFESTEAFDGLNDLLKRAEANYTEVIRLAKSYAEGNAGGIRDNEDIENAKYYYEQSKKNAEAASKSEENAALSEENAAKSETNAASSEANAKISEDAAAASAASVESSAREAVASAQNAEISEQNAKESEEIAVASAEIAVTSAASAKESAESIGNSANFAKSYAVGGTGTREGEDTDNARWYYNEMKDMFIGLNIVFVPKGTISFSELATAKETAVSGYVYNISDDFMTDDTFREGAGKAYTAGTNVYYTVDGYWDCFGGSASPTATIEEVKSYLGI